MRCGGRLPSHTQGACARQSEARRRPAALVLRGDLLGERIEREHQEQAAEEEADDQPGELHDPSASLQRIALVEAPVVGRLQLVVEDWRQDEAQDVVAKLVDHLRGRASSRNVRPGVAGAISRRL